MQRREFISLLGGASVLPIAARAQQQAMPVVGFLHVASAGAMSHLVAAFRQGLKDSGGDGNVPMEFRWAEGNYDRLQTLAADLVSRRVAVIITGGGENLALAAKAATSTIPIVFNIGNDPVKAGLVSSIGRPGGNITGVNILTTEPRRRRLGLLHELLPKVAVVAHLVNPNYPPTGAIVESVEAAARTLDRRIMLLKAGNDSEIDAAFASISMAK